MPDQFTMKMQAQGAMKHDIALAQDVEEKHKNVFQLQTKMEDASTKALSQDDVDRYQFLSSAFSGIDIPLEIQLAAYENHGEDPTGIELDQDILGGMDIIDWLREVVDLQHRKMKFGIQKGVVDPEDAIKEKQRAVVVYTRCALEIAEAEAIAEAAEEELRADPDLPADILAELDNKSKPVDRMVHFPAPDGASLGRNGHIHLFPGYPDSPAGMFRGDGAAFKAQECVDFIGKHFPEVEDEFLKALADA